MSEQFIPLKTGVSDNSIANDADGLEIMGAKDKEVSSIAVKAIAVLEAVAGSGQPLRLTELTGKLALPKPSVLRVASLLEREGLLQRHIDGKRFVVGPRLRQLALETLGNSQHWGPRHAILSALVEEIGETCNLTMLNGDRLVYVDRVECEWPLQMRLQPGSLVPLHCTASGKLFLSLMPPEKRAAFIRTLPLKRYTERTLIDPDELEARLESIAAEKVGIDNEEFIVGLVAVAVPVLDRKGRICATVAAHGPTGRFSLERARACVPALRRAAEAIARDCFGGR